MDYLVFRFKNAGGLMACGEKVIAVESVQDGYRVSTTSGSESLTCRILINCAGLYADEISAIFGIHIPVHWAKGDYYSVLRSMPSKLLIYPVPSRNALGIHITPKLEGGIRIGPDIEYVQKKYPPYPCDEPSAFTVDETKKEVFIREIQDFLPGIRKEDLVPEMYGIRPKLQGPSDDFRDFLIRDEKESGFPGFINLIGIESPGLTSCIAIGRYVKNIVRDML
jgi:L-2-hydroxyglutarate oxidase LhgO